MRDFNVDREELEAALEEMDESLLLMDGLDEALIGYSKAMNEPIKAVYSYEKIIDVFVNRDGMEFEEAEEFVSFNILGAYVGEQTPIVVMPLGY